MTITAHAPRVATDDIARALDPSVRGMELVALAVHRDMAVRAAVASRVDAPMATLISLAHERDTGVLEALLDNPSSPTFVVQKIAYDAPRGYTRERALARLRVIGWAA
jgi:hypothetical protein